MNIRRPVTREICTHIKCRLPFINTKPVYCNDLKLLAASPLSMTGRDKFIFLIDAERLKETRYRLPERDWGGYGFTRGSNGNLYIGMFSGKIYSFDLQERTFRKVAQPFVNGLLIWGGGSSSAGKIYMGVYPTSEFCEMDISTGDFSIYRPITDKNVSFYTRQFAEMPDGKMLIGITGGRASVFSFNPRDRKMEQLGEWMPEGRYPAAKYYVSLECFLDEKRFLISLGNRILIFNWQENKFEGNYATGLAVHLSRLVRTDSGIYGIGDDGIMYELREGMCRKASCPESGGNRLVYIQRVRGTEFMGLCDNGLFLRFNPAKKERQFSFQLKNSSKYGLPIQFIKKIPDSPVIAGSHFINMQMFKVNMKTGMAVSSMHKISPHIGQVTCGTFLQGKFYAFSYTRAVLHEMDASKPFIYGINPRIIGEAGHSQNRPVSAVNDGICVYAATFADYGQLGGAIVVFDPASEKIEAYRNFVRHQNPLTLFHHRKTGMLVGTTSVNADNGTCSPKAKQAFVFVWDTRLRKTVFKTAPWKMSSIHACDLSEEGVLIGFDKERYFLFDAARRTMKVMEWRHGFISSGVFLNPSEFMGSSGDAVIVLDIAKNRLERKIKIKGMTIAERFSERQALAIKNGLSIHLLTI